LPASWHQYIFFKEVITEWGTPFCAQPWLRCLISSSFQSSCCLILLFFTVVALYSFIHPSPSRSFSVRGAPGCGPAPGVMHPMGGCCGNVLSPASGSASSAKALPAVKPGAPPAAERAVVMCVLRFWQTRSQTFERPNISHLECLTSEILLFKKILFIPCFFYGLVVTQGEVSVFGPLYLL